MRQAPCRLLVLLCLIAHIATCYVVPRRVASFARLRIDTPRHRAVVARLLPEPVEKRFAAVARPTIGALGAGAFVAAAALAAYVGSRRQSES